MFCSHFFPTVFSVYQLHLFHKSHFPSFPHSNAWAYPTSRQNELVPLQNTSSLGTLLPYKIAMLTTHPKASMNLLNSDLVRLNPCRGWLVALLPLPSLQLWPTWPQVRKLGASSWTQAQWAGLWYLGHSHEQEGTYPSPRGAQLGGFRLPWPSRDNKDTGSTSAAQAGEGNSAEHSQSSTGSDCKKDPGHSWGFASWPLPF